MKREFAKLKQKRIYAKKIFGNPEEKKMVSRAAK